MPSVAFEKSLKGLIRKQRIGEKETKMTSTAQAGTVLVRTGTVTPELKSEPYSPGWETVQMSSPDALDRSIRKAGWNFFFFADRIQAISGLLSGKERAVQRAVERILAKAKPSQLNCLQITDISSRRYLGIPYIRVSAHARHIQRSTVLQTLLKRRQAELAVRPTY